MRGLFLLKGVISLQSDRQRFSENSTVIEKLIMKEKEKK